jgi:hypothetical protein
MQYDGSAFQFTAGTPIEILKNIVFDTENLLPWYLA